MTFLFEHRTRVSSSTLFKKKGLLLFILLFPLCSFSQIPTLSGTKKPPPPPPPPPPSDLLFEPVTFFVHQDCISINGRFKQDSCGKQKLQTSIQQLIQYPAQAINEHIKGMVVIQCYLDKDGIIKGSKLIKDIGGGCGEEAIRALQFFQKDHKLNTPWVPRIPSRSKNTTPKVYFNVPIFFELE